MPRNISKIELEFFSVFSIGSKKFGYGNYNRVVNLISILKSKRRKFFHYSYGEKYKNKSKFLDRLNFDLNLNRKIILDITNNLFLNKSTILRLKQILRNRIFNNIYIIDSPIKKNLSIILNLQHLKTLVPFETTYNIKKEFFKIKNKKIGMEYFIYPSNFIKKEKKIYDVTLSFGGSDNHEGTLYVLKLLEFIKVNKNVLVVFGKYFEESYKNKIYNICKKNKFKFISFSKNFSIILNKSKYLITNSGLTKYEGNIHGLNTIVFSDTKDSQKIDKVFVNKTNQLHFSYSKNFKTDSVKLKKYLTKKKNFKRLDKNILKTNIKKIENFFENE